MSVFISTLGQLGRRAFVGECDSKLAHLTQKVRQTGKPGKMVITLVMKPRKDTHGEEVDILEDCKIVDPVVTRRGTIMFTTEDGGLSRSDPNQADFAFQKIEGGKTDAPPAERISAVG